MMGIIRHRLLWTVLFTAALSITGCEIPGVNSPDHVDGTISISLGSAADAADPQVFRCLWNLEEVIIIAGDDEVGSASLTDETEEPVYSVEVPVSVPAGSTVFRAEVFTTSGDLAFEGETAGPVNVQEGIESVTINLVRAGPAMQICYDDELPQIILTNRGGGSLDWVVTSEETCDGIQCAFPSPDEGKLGAAATEFVNFELINEAGSYICVTVETDSGSLSVPICNFNFDVTCSPPGGINC